jgi:uncharacterized membrane protein
VVFPDESKATSGLSTFQDLHEDCALTLYGIAVLAKDSDGTTSIKQAMDEGPVGTGLGMLVGAMVGVIGGPAGVMLGTAGGALLGSISDLNNAGVGVEFLDLVGSKMEAGTVAVVSEVDEYWTAPLDDKMEAHGGTVFRRRRVDFEDEQFEQEIQAWNAELDELEAEWEQASDESKAKLQMKMDSIRAQLEAVGEKGEKKIEKLESELHGKVAEMDRQVATAKAEAKDKIEKRKAEMKASHEKRMAKLKKALSRVKEAVAA